jgi:hypothetical protein
MKSPRLFSVPARAPLPLKGNEGNILRRVRYALTPDKYVALLEEVSPARFNLATKTLRALESYVYHRVGPLYPTYNHVAQRDHFLPHTGLWAPVRQFDDSRVMTQLWLHTAAHEWYGWPLPVSTTYERYRQACFEGEILAVVESEFRFFQQGEHCTKGMFNPAFPSTFEALQAVGVKTPDEARKLLHDVQFNGGRWPHEVYEHPAYKDGVAITLLRQSSWPEHDEQFTQMHWVAQREPKYLRAYSTLWTPDRQAAITARHEAGIHGLHSYVEQKHRNWDELEGTRAVVRSMLRVVSLDVVQHTLDQDRAFGRIAGLFAEASSSDSLDRLREMAAEMPDVYDDILGYTEEVIPAPIWHLALNFRDFRVAWEARLQEKTALWREARAK